MHKVAHSLSNGAALALIASLLRCLPILMPRLCISHIRLHICNGAALGFNCFIVERLAYSLDAS